MDPRQASFTDTVSLPVHTGQTDQQNSLLTVTDLQQALATQQLRPYYQPQIDLVSGHIVGMELLARWLHPQRGLINPDDFIPLAETSGLIEPLTWQLLEQGLADMQHWSNITAELRLSVNLSALLLDDTHLAERLLDLLAVYDFPPQRLVLEITESAASPAPDRSAHTLAQLRAIGVELAIDDFGCGHSSLMRLYQQPYQELKIDKTFVKAADHCTRSAAIVRAITGMSQELGLRIVAEGVSGPESVKWLREIGCTVGQGYYFSRPLDASNMTALLKQNTPPNRPTPLSAMANRPVRPLMAVAA